MKPFLSYENQIEKLNEKGIYCDGSHSDILAKHGYFNLINGYKLPFVYETDNNKHKYYKGTTIEHLVALKNFDDGLRMLLFKYITKIETEIRSLSAYTFDDINYKKELSWANIKAYNEDKEKLKIIKLISNIYCSISQNKHSYLKHTIGKQNTVPTWIMIKVINFSDLITFIDYGIPNIKNNLCDTYNMRNSKNHNNKPFNHTLIIASLQCLRKARNICAHNERVYDISFDNSRVKSPYFDIMAKSYNKYNTRTVVDIIVYFKYFLSYNDFKEFLEYFIANLETLKNDVPYESFKKIISYMGIKNISDLEKLLQ